MGAVDLTVVQAVLEAQADPVAQAGQAVRGAQVDPAVREKGAMVAVMAASLAKIPLQAVEETDLPMEIPQTAVMVTTIHHQAQVKRACPTSKQMPRRPRLWRPPLPPPTS